VLVFSSAPAPRRLAAWLAAGALLVAASSAVARGPAGGYHETYDGVGWRWNGLGDGWLAARAPLRWLRQSSRAFQGLMRLLAERSAERGGAGAPVPPRPKRERAEPPQQEDWPQRSARGGEATAGRHRMASAVRVEDWRERSPWCRDAGAQARWGGWYVVQQGDTLWSISELHYGYGGAYRRILRANWQCIPDPGLIYPCQRLHIPRWGWSGYALEEPEDEPAPPTHGLAGLGRGGYGPQGGATDAEKGWP
jgi:hypothetical protein